MNHTTEDVQTREYRIKGYQPEALFHFFEDISAIPRSSRKEAGVTEYLEAFAKKRGLFFYTDAMHNVIIKKPAQNAPQDTPPVMLQGHTDMVCEKRPDVAHDFDTEGIDLIVEDGVLRANGTTLGGDNGVAVALMLAVLADDTISHPPLECVFTTQEEIGLNGARELDKSLLASRRMINLDSEEEGVATVSCAGGVRIECTKELNRSASFGTLLTFTISGLRGGHSGADIHKERANALVLAARAAHKIAARTDARLVFFSGGNKDNAIPRDASFTLLIDRSHAGEAADIARGCIEEFHREIDADEPSFKAEVTVEETEETACVDSMQTKEVLNLLFLAPNGIIKRNYQMDDFVVTSTNLGIVRTGDNRLSVTFAPRSSMDSQLAYMKERFVQLCDLFGFSYEFIGEYMGWNFAADSPLREVFRESYRRLFHEELKIESIHAGLECGLFCSAIKGMDAIAVGPAIYECHTPNEHMPLASFEKFYIFLSDVLAKLALAS